MQMPRFSLLLLFAGALALRCTGILWGGVFNDENIGESARALAGQLVPSAHYYPPFLNYLNAAAFAVMFAVGRAFSVWPDVGAFREQYFTDPSPFYAAARFVTAALGAASAPIGALIARQLGLATRLSFAVGALVAIFPPGVWLSHFSKSDVGMTTAFLAACWGVGSIILTPSRRSWVIYFIAVALALSFKQSSVFFLIPLSLFLLVFEIRRYGLNAAVLHFATFGIGLALVLPVLNLGITLDLSNFLEYQRVQAQMSARTWNGIAPLLATVRNFANPNSGPGLLMLLAFIATPFLVRSTIMRCWWSSALIGIITVMVVVAGRQKVGLWLPYSTLAWTFGAIACLSALKSLHGWVRVISAVVLAFAAGGAVLNSYEVLRQATAVPTSKQFAAALWAIPDISSTKVLTGDRDIGIPASSAAHRDEIDRATRLAEKYEVRLPPVAQERFRNQANSLYIRRFPWVIGGLEGYAEDKVDVIKPFAWPLQKEEWELDYWLEHGFKIFITSNEKEFLNSRVNEYRKFHEEIRARCKLLKIIDAERPLFLEHEGRIYDCKP